MASVFKRGGKSNREGFYYIAWHEWEGGRRRRRTKCSNTTDKSVAERIANKYEADAALRREGVVDPALEAIGKQSSRAIESHLKDYEAKLNAAGRSEQHVAETITYIRKICGAAGYHIASDIKPDGVIQFAGSLKDQNLSARTIHAYLTAIKGFTKWLSNNHKLPRDPLASVSKPNPDSDRRLIRRMVLPDEWQWIDSVVTELSLERYGMPAEVRLMLYETAIQSGLRSKELRSLVRGRLYFESETPYVTCKAVSTKNKQEARQYIGRDLADRLKEHISTKLPRSPLFGMPDETKVASMFRDDMADARKAWLDEARSDPQEFSCRQESDFLLPENHDGEVADFHALRHTCGAWLAMAGEHPKTVQTVMRHSTITLTMDTYGHLFPGQEAAAVEKFGQFLGVNRQRLAATGTTDASPKQRSARRSAEGATPCTLGATRCDETSDQSTAVLPINTENSATRCTPMQSSTMLCCLEAPLAQLAEQLTLNQ